MRYMPHAEKVTHSNTVWKIEPSNSESTGNKYVMLIYLSTSLISPNQQETVLVGFDHCLIQIVRNLRH